MYTTTTTNNNSKRSSAVGIAVVEVLLEGARRGIGCVMPLRKQLNIPLDMSEAAVMPT